MELKSLECEKAVKRMNDLRQEIIHHRFLYYVLDNPSISDAEFDRLFSELKQLEEKFPDLITPDSPTQTVGAKPSNDFKQVKHKIPMLSLANAMDEDDLDKWLDRLIKLLELDISAAKNLAFVCELKIDGLSISLSYENGKLIEGATRGDGEIGEDVLLNIKTIKAIPHKISNINKLDPEHEKIQIPKNLELRGEVYLPISSFNKLNLSLEEDDNEPFANPRNAASGSLRQKDPRVTALRNLSTWIYFSYINDPNIKEFDSHEESLKYLESLGFPVNKHRKLCYGIEEVKQFCREWFELRHTLDYQTDGIVIKLDKRKLWSHLGNTSHSPRWAIAFKYPPDEAETVLESIEYEIGRTGAVTPVACLRAVKLAGSTVKRASLHNFSQIARLNIKIGDIVIVRKAGEIIPEILRVVLDKRPHDAQNIEIPSLCPVCNSKLEHISNEIILRCLNIHCPAQLKRRLNHWVSRDAMDIEGMGEVLIDKLVETGLVKDPSDLYELNIEQLSNLERMGNKSALKLINKIVESKERSQANIIYALGIRHVGSRTAEILAEKFGSLRKLQNAQQLELEEIEGIGPTSAESIIQYFQDPYSLKLLARLDELGIKIDISQSELQKIENKYEQTLSGQAFVLTGSLSIDRVEAEKMIKTRGGKISSSVSKKTNYLICGENPGSKLHKAEELGITVLDEEEFKQLLGVSK